MALALLDLVGLEGSSVRFRIDTGTNRYYQLRLGRSVRDRSGVEWLDEVVTETPVTPTTVGGGLLDTSLEISVPATELERGRGFAQLYTFKTSKGGAPTFSPVVRVDRALSIPDPIYAEPVWTGAMEIMTGTRQTFARPRAVATRTCAEQFTAPALGDLLTQLVRVAGPVVAQLLGGPQSSAAGTQPGPVGGGTAAPAPGALVGLLDAFLRLIPGLGAPAAAAPPPAPPPAPAPQPAAAAPLPAAAPQPVAAPPLSGPASLGAGNRFSTGAGSSLARPFVFGIDDAILGAVIGQVVQVLPQLANAANQKRIQLQAGQNKLVSDIVAGVNQRLLLDQVLQAQQQAQAAQSADAARLAEMVQQAVAAAPPPGAPTTAPAATTQSLDGEPSDPALSSRAIVSFLTAPPVPWNGTAHVLFARGQPVRLGIQLTVAEPAPKTPLPKAIVRVVVKDPATQAVLAERVVKQKDLVPNTPMTVPFSAAELDRVPTGRPVSFLAEIRWLTKAGAERKALGSIEAVVVDRYFVKERGAAIGDARELTDMSRFRPFWNKVWESPALDAAAGGPRRLLWELDATMKYTVLLAPDHESNGVMETKALMAGKDADAVADRTEGRLKAGIELSLDELAKLAPLWEEPVLDAQRLAAFKTTDLAKQGSGEIVHRLRLKGRAAERGIVWVVPVLRLVEHTVGAVQTGDESGQVTGVTEEKVRVPLPVAVRVLALKSSDEAAEEPGTSGDEPRYVFDGYKVELSTLVALMPGGASAPAVEEQSFRG